MGTAGPLTHADRRAAILKAYPSIRALEGTEPRTALYSLAIISVQLTLAYLARTSVARALVLGLTVGPYIDAILLALIHEATHFLVFKAPRHGRWLAILLNVPMVMPLAEIFRQHHHAHHKSLGDPQHDVDVPMPFEVRVVGTSAVRKALWLATNMILLPMRSCHKLPVVVDGYLVANWVLGLGFGAVVGFLAPTSLLFLVLSTLSSQGLHPANARQLQRHLYDGREGRQDPTGPPTYSYYGPSNWITVNVGYHQEHHDFPRIPWTRLPMLRRMAGKEWYPDSRAFESRGLGTLTNFIFNDKISLADFAQ